MYRRVINNICATLMLVAIFVFAGCNAGPDPEKVVATQYCSLDNILGATGAGLIFSSPVGTTLTFQGWAVDIANGKVPRDVSLQLIDAKDQVVASYEGSSGAKRPDLVKAFNVPGIEDGGFGITGRVNVVPAEYNIQLSEYINGRLLVCRTNKKLVLH